MDPRGRAYERMGSFYTGFVAVFTLFMIGTTWTTELAVFGIMPQDGSPIGIIVGTCLGLGLILLGNYLPKVKPNYTFGCKDRHGGARQRPELAAHHRFAVWPWSSPHRRRHIRAVLETAGRRGVGNPG